MRKTLPLLILAFFSFICLGTFVLEMTTKVFHKVYDNYVLDDSNHYLPCRRWPLKAEAEKAVEEHPEIIQQIEQVNPGNVGIEMDTTSCPGKADLIIWYASHQNRLAIEKIIDGNTFFGVPYRMQNR